MNRVESSKFIMRMLKDENIFLRSRACSYSKLLQWNTSGRFIITRKFQFLRCLHETLSDKTNRFQPVAARRNNASANQLIHLNYDVVRAGGATQGMIPE